MFLGPFNQRVTHHASEASGSSWQQQAPMADRFSRDWPRMGPQNDRNGCTLVGPCGAILLPNISKNQLGYAKRNRLHLKGACSLSSEVVFNRLSLCKSQVYTHLCNAIQDLFVPFCPRRAISLRCFQPEVTSDDVAEAVAHRLNRFTTHTQLVSSST